MFNIAEFSSHVSRTGTLQTNKFVVKFAPPPVLAGSILGAGFSDTQKTLSYRISSFKVPGVSFDIQNSYRYGVGPQEKFPTNINFTDVSMNIIDTVNNSLWKYFYTWINKIFDYTGDRGGSSPNYVAEYKKYYSTDVFIGVYDNSAILANVIVLKHAYPTNIGDVNLSWADKSRLYEFSSNFTFREWYVENVSFGQFTGGSELGPDQTVQVPPAPPRSPRQPTPPTGVNDPVIRNGVQEGFVGLTGETVQTPVFAAGA